MFNRPILLAITPGKVDPDYRVNLSQWFQIMSFLFHKPSSRNMSLKSIHKLCIYQTNQTQLYQQLSCFHEYLLGSLQSTAIISCNQLQCQLLNDYYNYSSLHLPPCSHRKSQLVIGPGSANVLNLLIHCRDTKNDIRLRSGRLQICSALCLKGSMSSLRFLHRHTAQYDVLVQKLSFVVLIFLDSSILIFFCTENATVCQQIVSLCSIITHYWYHSKILIQQRDKQLMPSDRPQETGQNGLKGKTLYLADK